MKPEIILIQHTDWTTPGHVLPWLKSRNLPYRHLRMQDGDSLPQVHEASALILCGGGVHVDQEDKYPWLRPEKKFIESCISKQIPIVGLYLGGQLCAQILGAKVYPHPEGWEVGWHHVNLRSTPALPGFEIGGGFAFSQFHRYVFELPPEAQAVAWNDWWSVQAFEWKNKVLGFQFHPERDSEGNQKSASDPDLPSQGRIHPPDQILKLGQAHEPIAAKWFYKFLDGFVGAHVLGPNQD